MISFGIHLPRGPTTAKNLHKVSKKNQYVLNDIGSYTNIGNLC